MSDKNVFCSKCMGQQSMLIFCPKCEGITPTSKIDELIEKYETIDVIKVMGIRVLSANEVIKNLKKLKEGK